MRSVLITGASGFIGGHVVRRCTERGLTAWAWTRDVARTRARLGTKASALKRSGIESIRRSLPPSCDGERA